MGDHKYAYRNVTGWHIETIDWDLYGRGHSSLALDENGHTHISYRDYHGSAGGVLKYAYRDATGWHIETVDRAGGEGVGGYTSLALGESGYPHISYYDYTTGQLK